MTWAEVWLRYQGILSGQAPLRRSTHFILSALGVKNPDDVLQNWPLPFDIREEVDHRSTHERLVERLMQYKQQHGNPKA